MILVTGSWGGLPSLEYRPSFGMHDRHERQYAVIYYYSDPVPNLKIWTTGYGYYNLPLNWSFV